MNIYLTEMCIDETVYAGPNILAKDIIDATILANEIQEGLVVVGVIEQLVVLDDIFDETKNITIH